MEASGPRRPRVSRETRLRLTTGAIAVAALWMPARVRCLDQRAGTAGMPAISDRSAECAPEKLPCTLPAREELRRIVTFVNLVSERNRRRFVRWGQRLPSASYELVRRIHRFPYLPYNDTYGIRQILLTIDDSGTEISVRYRKHPDSTTSREVETPQFVTYSTDLSDLMRVIDRELVKLARFRKAP
jgi:hypothetical protein